MNDFDRIVDAFAQGTLLRPSAGDTNLVDLARAVATIVGVDGLQPGAVSQQLIEQIGPSEHLVFILADGLGMTMLEDTVGAGFLREHLVRELRTPFPSTTAVALTTLTTGLWPSQHGITGWWAYVPKIDDVAEALPFTRRSDERPLAELGVNTQDVFPKPSMWRSAARDVRWVMPEEIAGSIYTRYSAGDAVVSAYRTIPEAFSAVRQHVQEASIPAYTYVYLPQVDAAAHTYGTDSQEARAAIAALDHELAALSELRRDVRVVLSADHGHLAVPEERRHRLMHGEGPARMLTGMPAGDVRVPSFRVREQERPAFAEQFRGVFGTSFVLLTPDEIEALELLGPGMLSQETRQRVGDFVAISLGDDVMCYVGGGASGRALTLPSHHSGLTPAEMRIPLVLA